MFLLPLQTGNANKWMTPNHQAKQLDSLKPGDRGIWVTCHRHKEDRALKEISTLFSEVGWFFLVVPVSLFAIAGRHDAGVRLTIFR